MVIRNIIYKIEHVLHDCALGANYLRSAAFSSKLIILSQTVIKPYPLISIIQHVLRYQASDNFLIFNGPE